jgi:hypothetical protein
MSELPLDSAGSALRSLVGMKRKDLAKQWTAVFGSPAPRGVRSELLRGALAWRYQVGHEAETEVAQLICRLRRQAASPVPSGVLTPGTRLLREWQGQTHHVTVLGVGFEYEGKTYRSLTAISRQITGTAWSGPLFFGLR